MVTREKETKLGAWLRRGSFTMHAQLVCYAPRSDSNDWPHFEWRCTISIGSRSFTTAYRTGVAHCKPMPAHFMRDKADSVREHAWRQQPDAALPPDMSLVIQNMLNDADGATEAFDDWCSNFGESPDSRKALDTYLACQREGITLRRFFGNDYSTVAELAREE